MKMKNNFMVHWKNLRKTLIANYKQALQFGAWGAVGGCCGSLIGEVFGIGIRTNISDSFIPLFISVGIWFGIIGVCISIALLLGYSWYLKRGLRIGQSTKEGILPGFIAGFLAGAIAQYTFTTIGPTEFLRVICWGIAGGLLGVGLSFRIPNLGRLRGLAGGTIGGVIGGCLFILFTFLIGVVAGRLLGLAAIGFFIGLAIVLVEAAFREAWLIVHWTPTEQKTISLGTKPVLLGSSEDAHVYLKKSQGYPPITAKIYTEGEKIIMEFDETMKDKGMKILRHELANGDRRKVGDVMIEVKTATGNLP
jgi:Ca-activated chloride channel family protein